MRTSLLTWAMPVVALTATVLVTTSSPVSASGSAPRSAPVAQQEDFEGVLQSVSAVRASDVWAVGFHDDEDAGNSTVIEHWDGAGWDLVDGPELAESSLYGVSALSKTNAWAVGYYFIDNEYDTLVEHWDGTDWVQVASPSPGDAPGSFLKSVSARSSNDIWAVGYTAAGTLVEHWDGGAWSVVPSPGGAGYQLNGVTAIAANDAYAVGNTAGGFSRPLTLHWDGRTWSRIDTTRQDKAGHAKRLDGVSASSASDVWAVGTTIRYEHFTQRPLIRHWDGEGWKRIAGVDPGGKPGTRLTGVSAVSPDDVWAVGFFGLDDDGSYRAFIEHWDGNGWTWTHTDRPEGSRDDSVVGVDGLSPSRAWAAGAFTNLEESLTNTLTQNWNGRRWVQR